MRRRILLPFQVVVGFLWVVLVLFGAALEKVKDG